MCVCVLGLSSESRSLGLNELVRLEAAFTRRSLMTLECQVALTRAGRLAHVESRK